MTGLKRTTARVWFYVEGESRSGDVRGWTCREAPGLILHWMLNNGRACMEYGWAISHVPSGAAVVKYLPNLHEATRALVDLAAVADWTQDAATLAALPNICEVGATANRIMDRNDAPLRYNACQISPVALKAENELRAARSASQGGQK